MNRRTFLQRSGGLTALAGLAGCLGSTQSDSAPADRDGNQTDGTTDNSTTEDSKRRFSGVQSDHDEPFQTISVGSREKVAFPDNNRPRGVRVWNAADETREIDLEISRDAEIVVDRTIEFAADAYLEATLNEPANYEISVGLAGDGTTTFSIERTEFDCNSAGTDMGVMADGRVETMSASTAAGCSAPEIADTNLSAEEGTCGRTHSASVAFETEAVSVSGAVRTSTPDSGLALAAANYDRETDTLTIRVRATGSDGGGAGVQCVGEVPYEATVAFDYDLPSSVAVVHESMDETVEVTNETR